MCSLSYVQANEELQARLEALRSQPSALLQAQAKQEEHVRDRDKFRTLIDNLQVSPCLSTTKVYAARHVTSEAGVLSNTPGGCCLQTAVSDGPRSSYSLLLHMQRGCKVVRICIISAAAAAAAADVAC